MGRDAGQLPYHEDQMWVFHRIRSAWKLNPRSFRFRGGPDYACVPSDATNVILVNDQDF